ncbi:hypothetical protein [Sorangium sp. So ce363]|uniref:hypothetical protein n=1 Tax=Sorangium sp. So ce363 TaxID=3133304 RepID=UPI003F60BF04
MTAAVTPSSSAPALLGARCRLEAGEKGKGHLGQRRRHGLAEREETQRLLGEAPRELAPSRGQPRVDGGGALFARCLDVGELVGIERRRGDEVLDRLDRMKRAAWLELNLQLLSSQDRSW